MPGPPGSLRESPPLRSCFDGARRCSVDAKFLLLPGRDSSPVATAGLLLFRANDLHHRGLRSVPRRIRGVRGTVRAVAAV